MAAAARAARARHADQTNRDSARPPQTPISESKLAAWQIASLPVPDQIDELKVRGIAFVPDEAHLSQLKDARIPAELLAVLTSVPPHSDAAGSAEISQPLIAAAQAFSAKDYASARRALESLVQKNGNADLYAALGNLQFVSNDLPSARNAFERAVQLDPSMV